MFRLVVWVKQLVVLQSRFCPLSILVHPPIVLFYALHCYINDVSPHFTLLSRVPGLVQLDAAGSVATFCALTTLNNGN